MGPDLCWHPVGVSYYFVIDHFGDSNGLARRCDVNGTSGTYYLSFWANHTGADLMTVNPSVYLESNNGI